MEDAKVQKIESILEVLSAQHPTAGTELQFEGAFQLLVATVLSVQSNDKKVNQVTRVLFRICPTSHLLQTVNTRELEKIIRPVGLHKTKARDLTGIAQVLEEKYDGLVPDKMEELLRLPGVGRKTANVVLGHGFGLPALPVDRHVLRVCNRLGVADHSDVKSLELQLSTFIQPTNWLRMSDCLIIHGRRICKPRPTCEQCGLAFCCNYFNARS